jgi:hypothetical protein
MTRTGCALGILLLMTAPAFAQQTNVAGDWEVTLLAPTGPNTFTVTLKQDGEKVAGTLKNRQGEMPFQEGTLTGDDLKFAFSVPFQGTPLQITLTGKVKGETIEGKADFGGMAEGDWTAKRVDPNAVAAAPAAPAATAPPTNGDGNATIASTGGVAGKWDVTFMTPQGEFPATAMLTDEGGKLSGTFASQMGQVPVSGTLAGKILTLTLVAESPQGSMNVSMSGELSGDAIVNGKADVSGMGQMEWSAKRARQ